MRKFWNGENEGSEGYVALGKLLKRRLMRRQLAVHGAMMLITEALI